MFCGMAVSTPQQGDEEKLVRAATEHAAALRRQPGCIAAYVLTERGGTSQVSISIFETERAFNQALEATRPVIAKHNLERILEGPSTFQVFDVR